MKSLSLVALALSLACGCSSPPMAPADSGGGEAPLAAPPVRPEESQGLAPETFKRIAIIGASSAAGFNLQFETGVPTRLADYVDEALKGPHRIAYDGATELLFLDPEGLGAKMATEALAAEPTLLIAPDFLFWFFYGSGSTTEARRARLEAGLALLEPFNCPIVIGDLPYMQEAAGGMIPYSSMPAADSFDAANARIREWAKQKGDVAIAPFVAVNRSLHSGAPYVLGDFTWDPAELGSLLQADHLHPNLAGTAILCLEVLKSLAESHGQVLADIAEVNPEDLVDEVDDRVSSR